MTTKSLISIKAKGLIISSEKRERFEMIVLRRKSMVKQITTMEFRLKELEKSALARLEAKVKVFASGWSDVTITIGTRSAKTFDPANSSYFLPR